MSPVLRTSLSLAVLALVPATLAAQPAPPPITPPLPVAEVPGGDLSARLSGWLAVGPSMVLVAGPIIEAADNTTVVSPPFTVPASGQDLPVVLGVPGANAVVRLSARPVDGGPDVPLATIVPDRAVREWQVGVGAVRGRTVRLVIDPVTSMGRRLYVRSVGPVREVLPGWEVTRGVPSVATIWGRSGIVVDDEALATRTPVVAIPPGTRFLGLQVRGSGSVRASVGGRTTRATATTSRWTAVRVPVRGTTARMSLTLAPAAAGRLVASGVATPVRQARITRVSVAGGVVRALVTPDAGGMVAEVRSGSGVVGRSTVRADGMVVVRARASGPARLVVLDDAAHIGAGVPVMLG